MNKNYMETYYTIYPLKLFLNNNNIGILYKY